MTFTLIVVAALAAEPAAADPRLLLLDAMAQELKRNQTQLKLEDHGPPYFISYQVKDYDERQINARYGALYVDEVSRDRKIYVDLRVGDYLFDNSVDEEMDFNFSLKGTSYVSRKNAPIDDDPIALRNNLWLITDEKYKSALFNFLKKKGEGVYTVVDPKKPPSFTKEKPNVWVGPKTEFKWDRELWKDRARKLSARFNAQPKIIDSDVLITGDKVVRYFVSTEGGRIVSEESMYGVHLTAITRADDGQLLDMSRDYYAPTQDGLPSYEKLVAEQDKIITELLALRAAPSIDPYTGPAILEPEAAGVMFHEIIGHRLEGERQDNDAEGKTFRGQVGKPVLPAFLSVIDDPTVRTVNNKTVNGHYEYDEEGVKAQKVTLVENGVLRGYLLSRRPTEGFLQSNGHGRSQGNRKPVARMANLIVASKKTVTDEELKRMLIAEAKRQDKPYGLIIRDITGGNTNTSSFGYQAFKGIPRMVYRVDVKDGKETLVRGVEIVGTPLSSINRVLATGPTSGIFNGFCGAESGNVPVSAVAPSVLIQEIELQRTLEGKDRPPLLPSPMLEKAPAK